MTLSKRILVAIAVGLATMAASAQVVTINQGFTGTTAPGWVLGGSGYTPILTAAQGIDPNGSGWLRLTSSSGNQATYAYNSTAFNAANATIAVQFNYASYNGTGADGLTFFLADASKTFGVGAYGGSLGYAQKTLAGGGGADINGMNGGYIGLGVDEYGNYANPTEGRIGGIGPSPNAISVRGPGDGLTGYEYLGGTGSLSTALAFPGSTTRPTGADTRTIRIVITATNQLTVYLATGTSGQYVPLYTVDLSGYTRPDQLIMGFTGSTGGSTDIHEIQNVSLSSVAANLWTNAAGTGTWGTTAANWNGTVAPATGADILLDNTYVSGAQSIDVGQNRIVRSLQIDAPFSYTLNNGSLEFNNEGVLGPSGILVSQTHGSATQTINSDLTADNDIEINNSSAGVLNLTGSLATNGHTVTMDGSGNTTLAGAVSGTGALVKNDSGNATLAGDSSYSGGTTLNAGTLTADNNNALGTGTVTVNGGTLASDSNNTVGNAITLQGDAGLSNITTSGTLTQTNGSYTLALSGATQAGAVNLSNNNTGRTLTVQVDSGTSTISGTVQNGGTGAGGLTKTGLGTLVLSGANTYTGATSLNAGTVQLGASSRISDSSAVAFNGGTLNLAGYSEKVGNLSIGSNSSLDFGSATGANTFVFDNLTSASGVLTIDNWEQAADFFGATTGNISTTLLSSIYFSGYGSGATEATNLTNTTFGNAYAINPNAITWSLWTSNRSNRWNRSSNWSTYYYPNGSYDWSRAYAEFGTGTQTGVDLNTNVTLNGLRFDAGAASYTVTGSRTMTMSGQYSSSVAFIQQQSANDQTLTFSTLDLARNTVADVTGSGNLVIGSAIAGSSNLVKEGTGGKLILSGNNGSFSGGVFVNHGTLEIQNGNALGNTSGTTTVAQGATLAVSNNISSGENIGLTGQGVGNAGAIENLSGTNTLSGTLTLNDYSRINSDAGTLNLSGNVTSGTGAALTLGGAGAMNVSGTIATGAGAVIKDGSGTVTFSGNSANTYSGTTTVNAGTLLLQKSSGVNAVAGNLDVEGGTARLGADNQIADSAAVTVGGSGVLDLNGHNETIAGLNGTSGGAAVTLGSGVLTISSSGGSSYAGSISGTGSLVKAGSGELDLSGGSSYSGGTDIQSGIISIANGSALGTGTVSVANSGNLQIQGNVNVANNLSLAGNGTYAGDGAVESYAGTNTLSGSIALTAASRMQSDAGSTLNVAGNVNVAGNTLNVGGTGNTVVAGVISGTGALTKDGTGTLTLSGANTYTGGTTINAGTLRLGASERLADSGAVTVAGGATFDVNGHTETIGALSGAGTLQLASGTLIAGSGNASSTFSGSFAGGDTGTFEKTGTGTLTFGTGMNFASGDLVLNGGTLNLGGFTSTFSALTVTGNSVLDFSGTSILNLDSVTVAAGVTLTVTNWADTVDYFYSLLNPGSTNLGHIVFAGYTAGDTKWQSFDHEITPVPEPGTYGALFMLLGLGLVLWVRRERSGRAARHSA